MALNEATVLGQAKDALLVDLADRADADLYGLDSCCISWADLFLRYYVIDELECATNQFSQDTKDCLLSKLVESTC